MVGRCFISIDQPKSMDDGTGECGYIFNARGSVCGIGHGHRPGIFIDWLPMYFNVGDSRGENQSVVKLSRAKKAI